MRAKTPTHKNTLNITESVKTIHIETLQKINFGNFISKVKP